MSVADGGAALALNTATQLNCTAAFSSFRLERKRRWRHSSKIRWSSSSWSSSSTFSSSSFGRHCLGCHWISLSLFLPTPVSLSAFAVSASRRCLLSWSVLCCVLLLPLSSTCVITPVEEKIGRKCARPQTTLWLV